MDEQIRNALITLALIIVAGLGTLVKLLIDRLASQLRENTAITTEARDASNGQLSDALFQLATERNRVLGLRAIVREREDRIAYILARHPEVWATMQEYGARLERRRTEADEIAAERHVLGER